MHSRTFFLLAPPVVAFSVGMDIYVPFLLQVSHTFNVKLDYAQLTLSLYLFALAAGQLIIGLLADRYGRKPVLVGSGILFTLASLISAISWSMGILVLMRFIQGLSACGLRSTAYAVVRDNTQDSEFGSNMSALYSLVSLSPIMAPFLGGLLVWLFGWRGVFVFLSFFGILVIVCSYFIEDVYRPGQQSSFHLGGILKAMIDSQNWIGGLIFAAGVTSMFCFASSTSYITHQQFGMPHYYIYISFALIGTMMLFIGHLSNRLFKRFRNDQVFIYGALIIMTSTGLLAFLSWQVLIDYWWYIGICMMGVSLSALMVGTGMGIGLDGRNQNIGLAIAVISMLGYSIPAALGWVMALNNPDALSFALTISLFYLFVLGLWLFKAQKHR